MNREIAGLRTEIAQAKASICAVFDGLADALDRYAVAAQPAPVTVIPRLYTIEEVAKLCGGLKRDTLLSYVRKGELLPADLPSGRGDRRILRFRASDVSDFVERHISGGVA